MKEKSMGSIYLKNTSNIVVPECISKEIPRSVEWGGRE